MVIKGNKDQLKSTSETNEMQATMSSRTVVQNVSHNKYQLSPKIVFVWSVGTDIKHRW